jgi:S1-C subfamily serine protease
MLDANPWPSSALRPLPPSRARTAIAAPPSVDAPARAPAAPSQSEVASMAPLVRAVVRLRVAKAGAADSAARSERGFLVDSQGYIITSARVVSEARRIEAILHDGRTLTAELVARDPLNDVAVLKVPATGLPTIALGDSGSVVTGESVLAAGPPGRDRELTVATVRATGAATGGNLAVDFATRPGGWGGPLLNRRGQAIGVLTDAGGAGGAQRSTTFAVPIDRVKGLLRNLPWAAISAWPTTSDR